MGLKWPREKEEIEQFDFDFQETLELINLKLTYLSDDKKKIIV
jgi:hypothetical protein